MGSKCKLFLFLVIMARDVCGLGFCSISSSFVSRSIGRSSISLSNSTLILSKSCVLWSLSECCNSLLLFLIVIEVVLSVLLMLLVTPNSWHFVKSSITCSSNQWLILSVKRLGAIKFETSSKCLGSSNLVLNSKSSTLTLFGKSSKSFVYV